MKPSPIKTPKELTKAKKVAKKRVAKKVPIFDDIIIDLSNTQVQKYDFDVFKLITKGMESKIEQNKPKTNYLKDGLVVLGTVAIIFTVAWLATLEAGTLKTCYEIWQSVK